MKINALGKVDEQNFVGGKLVRNVTYENVPMFSAIDIVREYGVAPTEILFSSWKGNSPTDGALSFVLQGSIILPEIDGQPLGRLIVRTYGKTGGMLKELRYEHVIKTLVPMEFGWGMCEPGERQKLIWIGYNPKDGAVILSNFVSQGDADL